MCPVISNPTAVTEVVSMLGDFWDSRHLTDDFDFDFDFDFVSRLLRSFSNERCLSSMAELKLYLTSDQGAIQRQGADMG